MFLPECVLRLSFAQAAGSRQTDPASQHRPSFPNQRRLADDPPMPPSAAHPQTSVRAPIEPYSDHTPPHPSHAKTNQHQPETNVLDPRTKTRFTPSRGKNTRSPSHVPRVDPGGKTRTRTRTKGVLDFQVPVYLAGHFQGMLFGFKDGLDLDGSFLEISRPSSRFTNVTSLNKP